MVSTAAGSATTDLLADVMVLELGGGSVRAAYAGRLLADLGARVVKIAPPRPPVRTSNRRMLDAFLDRGKEGVVLPDEAGERSRRLAELGREASVVIHDVHADHAIDDAAALVDALATIRLRDTVDSMIGSAPTPELLLQAQAGWIYGRGSIADPVRVGGRMADFAIGAFAAVGALVALMDAEGSGTHPLVELSAVECLYVTLPLSRFYRGPQKNRLLDAGPPGILECADGWVGINCLTGQHWEDFCALVGLSERSEDLAQIKDSTEALAEFRSQVPEWFLQQPADDIVSICQAMRIPAAPVGTGTTTPQFEHWRVRESFTTMTVDGVDMICPKPPFRMHRDSVRSHAGHPPTTATASTPAGRPLEGCRVLDLGTFWAAPYVTSLMGALGADVLKVEGPQHPDGFRYFGVSPSDGELWHEMSAPWQATNLNKRGIAVDLATGRGRELLLRLAEDADVVIENFSARVLDQFNLDFAAFAERNPAISLLRMPAYGLDGPWRDYVGWAATFEEIAGLAQVTGFPEGPPNIPGGQSDPVAGLHGAVLLLAAMRRTRRTGTGSMLELAISDVMLYLSAEQLLDSATSGVATTRRGNAGPDIALEDVRRDPDNGWLAVSDSPESFDGLGVQSMPVVAAQDLATSAVLADSGMITDFEVEGAPGGRAFLNWPLHINGVRVVQQSAPPALGEHTREILAELGLSDDEIGELQGIGVISAPSLKNPPDPRTSDAAVLSESGT